MFFTVLIEHHGKAKLVGKVIEVLHKITSSDSIRILISLKDTDKCYCC